MKIRHIPEWSIVRLADERVGTVGAGRKIVMLSQDHGVEVKPSTEVDVILYPAQLAMAYLGGLKVIAAEAKK
jgi:hypothetical protein